MGLFDMFKKKECSICGGEIGLLGNRKLEDGNMCKHCAEKLSPWFSDRRESTVAQINEQLAYREANKAKVAAFKATRTLGERRKVLIDENAGLFMVPVSATSLQEENPDVLALTDIVSCRLDIDEDQREIMNKDKDGKPVSYNPRRFDYYYDFKIIMEVRNPYFDEIRFQINSNSVEIEYARMMGMRLRGAESDMNYRRYKEMGEEICRVLLDSRRDAAAPMAQAAMAAAAAAIGGAAPAAAPAPAPAANAPVVCPYCGATTTPNGEGCCEYCGTPVK